MQTDPLPPGHRLTIRTPISLMPGSGVPIAWAYEDVAVVRVTASVVVVVDAVGFEGAFGRDCGAGHRSARGGAGGSRSGQRDFRGWAVLGWYAIPGFPEQDEDEEGRAQGKTCMRCSVVFAPCDDCQLCADCRATPSPSYLAKIGKTRRRRRTED